MSSEGVSWSHGKKYKVQTAWFWADVLNQVACTVFAFSVGTTSRSKVSSLEFLSSPQSNLI